MGSWQRNLQHLVPYIWFLYDVSGAIIYLTGDREGYDCTFYAKRYYDV
jgi:ubiquinone biosynthesis protein COQ9